MICFENLNELPVVFESINVETFNRLKFKVRHKNEKRFENKLTLIS